MNRPEGLHDWREAAVEMALEERFGAAPPRDLADRIVQRVLPSPRRSTARPPSRLAAAALLLLGVAVVLGVAWSRPEARPAQDRDQRLLPLEPRAVWTYDVRRDGATSQRRCTAMAAAAEASTPRYLQLLVQEDGAAGFECAAIDQDGVWRRGDAGSSGAWFDGKAAATLLLPLPVGSRTQWDTEGEAVPPRPAGPGGGMFAGKVRQPTASHRRGELLAARETVKVPAGSFEAAHVRLSPRDAAETDQGVLDLWFAPGTGIVRRVLSSGGKEVEVAELTAFTPGRPDPDASAALAAFLRRDAGIANLGPAQATQWIESPARLVQLHTRFAVVTFVDRKLVFAVRDGKVAAFDPETTDAWTQLLAAEDMTQWSNGMLPQARCMALGDLAGRIRGTMLDLTQLVEAPAFMRVSIGPGGADYSMALVGKNGDGKAQRVNVHIVILPDDTVAKLELGQ